MKALVLLSGGLDSAVVLAWAKELGRECIALSFDYHQRHRVELDYAKKLAEHYGVLHHLVTIDNAGFAGSALLGSGSVPINRDEEQIATGKTPNTYVPARNTLFIAYAASFAEALEVQEIYLGPNALDREPYPDCRPEFYCAFQDVLNIATKQAIEGNPPKLVTPLINWDKRKIVQEAIRLHVPIEKTFSCYAPLQGGEPCGRCDACCLRESALSSLSKANL